MSVFRKVTLFLVGYCAYISIEVTFRGYSYILMGICGGILFMLIDCINDKISWNVDLLAQGCIGSLMITGCELIIGKTIKALSLPPMWDYSNMLFNYDGIICLEFSVLWVILSIIAVFIADGINYYIFNETPVPHYKLFGKTIITFKTRQ